MKLLAEVLQERDVADAVLLLTVLRGVVARKEYASLFDLVRMLSSVSGLKHAAAMQVEAFYVLSCYAPKATDVLAALDSRGLVRADTVHAVCEGLCHTNRPTMAELVLRKVRESYPSTSVRPRTIDMVLTALCDSSFEAKDEQHRGQVVVDFLLDMNDAYGFEPDMSIVRGGVMSVPEMAPLLLRFRSLWKSASPFDLQSVMHALSVRGDVDNLRQLVDTIEADRRLERSREERGTRAVRTFSSVTTKILLMPEFWDGLVPPLLLQAYGYAQDGDGLWQTADELGLWASAEREMPPPMKRGRASRLRTNDTLREQERLGVQWRLAIRGLVSSDSPRASDAVALLSQESVLGWFTRCKSFPLLLRDLAPSASKQPVRQLLWHLWRRGPHNQGTVNQCLPLITELPDEEAAPHETSQQRWEVAAEALKRQIIPSKLFSPRFNAFADL